jgi:hypothetical protein
MARFLAVVSGFGTVVVLLDFLYFGLSCFWARRGLTAGSKGLGVVKAGDELGGINGGRCLSIEHLSKVARQKCQDLLRISYGDWSMSLLGLVFRTLRLSPGYRPILLRPSALQCIANPV